MKVLVTGGAGEVGKYLTNHLLGCGHEIGVLDLPTKALEMEKDSRITFTPGNLMDAEPVNNALRGVDVVIHLAWSFSDDPRVVFGEDIKGHVNLLEAASSSRVSRFIYASTATVYGRAVHHPVTETHPCLIGDARKPLYALGKRTAEELCLLYSKERGLPVTIFRFWWAFGESIGGRRQELLKVLRIVGCAKRRPRFDALQRDRRPKRLPEVRNRLQIGLQVVQKCAGRIAPSTKGGYSQC